MGDEVDVLDDEWFVLELSVADVVENTGRD